MEYNTIDEEVKEWLKSDLPPFIDGADVGKRGTIKEVKMVNTKYGQRLRVDIEIDGVVKSLFLGKSLVNVLVANEKLGPEVSKWVGKIVKVVSVITTKGNYRPMITPE